MIDLLGYPFLAIVILCFIGMTVSRVEDMIDKHDDYNGS